jgi:hypothetical protein
MQGLARDPRGYPIPKGVLIDADGRPHFTINDEAVRQRHIAEERCPICDGRLRWRGRWFVGGPRAAFHPNGAYLDPPMHDECAHYALKVCPYLAAPNYGKRLDDKTLRGPQMLMIDDTMIPDRPALFVAVLARSAMVTERGYLVPTQPFLRVEYWLHGQQLPAAEGGSIADQVMAQAVLPVRRVAARVFMGGRGR